MKNAYFCVDIGGTKTACAMYDEQGQELLYHRFATEPELGTQSLVERVYQCVKEEWDGYRILRGGIASPGPLDMKTGKILHVVTMGWKNVEIVKLFSERFGISFDLLNDCDAGALGVASLHAFSKHGSLAYMSLSTGVGGGIVVDGKVYMGQGNAANFGHMPVPGEGLVCGCGRVDCLELYASGSGIERRYAQKTGEHFSCMQIEQAAKTGDSVAVAVFEEAAAKLAFAVDALFAVLDPEILVLGGSVCRSGELLLGKISSRYPIGFAPDDGKQVLLGACAYAMQQHR